MIAKREIQHTKIYQDLSDTDREYWFDFKKNKFLHNIDTFYYSVKLLEDFTDDSKDDSVLKLRQFFDKKKSLLASRHGESVPFIFPAAIVLSTCVLGLLLAFSIYVWKIRNGSIYLLLLSFLMVLMVVYQLLVRSWFRSVLTCYGCTEFMRVLNAPIIL